MSGVQLKWFFDFCAILKHVLSPVRRTDADLGVALRFCITFGYSDREHVLRRNDCISSSIYSVVALQDGISISSLGATRYLYYSPLDYFTFTRISLYTNWTNWTGRLVGRLFFVVLPASPLRWNNYGHYFSNKGPD